MYYLGNEDFCGYREIISNWKVLATIEIQPVGATWKFVLSVSRSSNFKENLEVQIFI